MGKLAQAIAHGAVVLQIRGNFDDGMCLINEVAAEAPVAIVMDSLKRAILQHV